MARALLLVERRRGTPTATAHFIEALNRRLTPDNIAPRRPQVARDDGVTAAIFNPNGATRLEGASISIGAFFEPAPDWHKPGSKAPSGTYALLRCDADSVELVADAAGSRTVWYALTVDMFVASTSQRAIVALLGNFEVNRQALHWMLSSGTLGPDGGWDARLRCLGPDERVTLDRHSWRLTSKVANARFAPEKALGAEKHFERLTQTIRSVCDGWSFDPRKWLLPLSGGVDSRGLLLLLQGRPGLQTVTWGTNASRTDPGNDAMVAGVLAEALDVQHRFYSTDLSHEPRERLFERFLVAGEGRVARISGYLDGFRIWKTLYEEGIDGVIRGDEALGSLPVRNVYNARFRGGLTLLSDYFAPAELEAFELTDQRLPENFLWRREETLATWRDRTYLEFRVPTMLAALTDLKSPYVEVANPLLAGPVLACVRALPDKLRTDKLLWRRFVASQRPDIPFATHSAIVQLTDFVNDPAVVRLMVREMESPSAAELFAPPLRMRVSAGLDKAVRRGEGRRKRITIGLPRRLRTRISKWIGVRPEIQPTLFAFRAFIASRMNSMLKEDARSLSSMLPRQDERIRDSALRARER